MGQFKDNEGQRSAHMGSWSFNAAGFDYWSSELFQIHGLDPNDGPPTVEEYLNLVYPEDRQFIREGMQRMLAGHHGFDFKSRIVRPDGKIRHIRWVGVPVTNGLVFEGFVGTGIDVTEQQQLERERERLLQLEADLAHINRVSTMGELAASLSHELKQPITATVSNAQTAMRWLKRDQPDSEEACEALKRIVEDGKRAADIIDRLRSLYKKASPKREPVDMNEIIGEMVVLLRGEANRYGVWIRTDLAVDLPNVSADRVQLQQVLMNLILNAIEAMRETGGVLTVKSDLDQDGGVLTSVSDTGVGFPAEMTDQIFGAFFTTKPQGSGMGLAISRTIIDSHGGRLWAMANDGRGARFHFTVPTAAQEVKVPVTRT